MGGQGCKVNFRALGVVAGVSLVGVSLVGVGVYAARFPSRHEGFESHGLSVVLSADGASRTLAPTMTLTSVGPTGSSFQSAPTQITIINNGSIAAAEVALSLGDNGGGVNLESETWVCLYNERGIVVNEPLAVVNSYGQAAIGNLTLAPGATDSYTVVYYAGNNVDTGCGGPFTGYSPTPYNGYRGQYISTEPYPSGSTNPEAQRLTNTAEGQTITPTVTFTYVGVPHTIHQVPPLGDSVIAADSGSNFNDQLNVAESHGMVSYAVTSPNSHLQVTSAGVVTTVGGPLAVGTYTISGTDSDALGATGSWAYTLNVVAQVLSCTHTHQGSVRWSDWGDFEGQLAGGGAVGTVTYLVTSPYSHIHVSGDGRISTYGAHLSPGTYTISGDCDDSYGDTGTWSYKLTVSK